MKQRRRSGTVSAVNAALEAALLRHDGVLTWSAALRWAPEHVLCHAVRAGHVAVPFRRALMHPSVGDQRPAMYRAALACAGPGAALSHTTALAVWGLAADNGGEVHLMTGPQRRVRVRGLVAHRRAGFVAEPPQVVVRAGVPVTALERSVVDAWGQLAVVGSDVRRAPLLRAVNSRMTTPTRVAEVLDRSARLRGRSELSGLLAKLRAGCRSELELWGYDRVFTGPGMPVVRWQVPVTVAGQTWYLDVLHEPSRTNFELDGTRWHADPRQREHDLRRDAALATLAIHSVRYSHDRLTREPERVRREILAIIAARSGIAGPANIGRLP